MAPVLEIETLEIETEIEQRPEIGERHRVLIAAAVAAVVGGPFRILEIKPAEPAATGWKHCGRISKPVTRAVLRRRTQVRTRAARKEDKR